MVHCGDIITTRFFLLGRLPLVFAIVLLYAQLSFAADPVGNVLLSAGSGWRISDGTQVALRQGDPVFVGDRIATGKAAMLQLKMIDDALLILQSDSELLIEAYTYNPASPADQAAKLTLTKGRLRSITGKLGESNHDAFRLNTPIAAIGIRGTDFEISTDDEVTRVRLNSGAVVFAALSDNCRPESLGPCQSENSLLLTEGLESSVAELRASDSAPRLIQLRDFNPQSLNMDGATQDSLLSKQRTDSVEKAVGSGRGGDPGQPVDPEDLLPDGWVDKIHWGRWETVFVEDTPTYLEVGGSGKETLFTNGIFVLYRNNDFSRLGNDTASFTLLDAQAVLFDGSASVGAVAVNGGSLSVDFLNRSFNTNLSLSSQATGSLALTSYGDMDSAGLFRGRGGSMSVLGGFSQDAEQAGYLFEHGLNNGLSVQGATQWFRP